MIEVKAPASKSMSHRALIAAALAMGRSRLTNVLDSRDIRATAACLSACGAEISAPVNGEITVHGVDGELRGGVDEPVMLNVEESGTTCRLVTALLAAGKGLFSVHGEGRMHDRPIGELADALLPQGANFYWLEKDGYPPFVLEANGLKGGTVRIGMEESSQYLSGILLAAPMAGRDVTVEISGRKVVSWPYVALTLQVLRDFGISCTLEIMTDGSWEKRGFEDVREVEPGKARFTVKSGVYKANDYSVEGDFSNASYFLAAGAIGKTGVRVRNLRADSLQGDRKIVEILARMGAVMQWVNDGVEVSPGKLRGVELDMGSCPDLVPTVAVVAAMAEGSTTIRNVAHLRIKESDRLQAVADELTKAGARVETFDDGLTIHPAALIVDKEIDLLTYADHRMAMSLSVLEVAGVKVRLDNMQCVEKSFPGFWGEWVAIRAGMPS